MNPEGENYDLRLLRSLRQVIRAVDKYSHKLNTELGLTTPQLLCLDTLAKSENLMTQTGLCAAVNLGASTINGIVDRLEAKQYLVRQRSHLDRRQVFLQLTPAGHGIVDKAPMLLQYRLSASLRARPELEQKNITEALEKVVSMMEVEAMDASPNLFARDTVEPE
ncbi:MAG: MarR family winged helix-turn-helix transcriptional regulator [Victivallaceae bacterium]|nr:MarR family transcriptional regulator [Victivallaceae bacterium]